MSDTKNKRKRRFRRNTANELRNLCGNESGALTSSINVTFKKNSLSFSKTPILTIQFMWTCQNFTSRLFKQRELSSAIEWFISC